jgi:hypothetical protein
VGCLPQVLADYSIGRPGAASRNSAARLAALRVLATQHATAARRQDPSALAACEVRLLVAEAEVAEAEGRRYRAAMLRVGALLRQPSRRLVREAAAGVLAAVQG